MEQETRDRPTAVIVEPEKKEFHVTFSWLKEQMAASIVGTVFLLLGLLVAWAVVQAFVGDYRINKATEDIRTEFISRHNDTVKREADLLKQLVELKVAFENFQTVKIAKDLQPIFNPAFPVPTRGSEVPLAPISIEPPLVDTGSAPIVHVPKIDWHPTIAVPNSVATPKFQPLEIKEKYINQFEQSQMKR